MCERKNQIFCACGNGSFFVKNDEVMRLICTKCREVLKVVMEVDVVVKG